MLQYVDPSEPRGPGARADADARALHPGHAGAARLRRGARASTSSRCSAALRSAPSRPSCAPAGTSSSARSGACSDLISRHSLVLHDCRFVVLDEADEMLDLGFLEDVERILVADPLEPPDGAVLGDDAAARSASSPSKLPVRPGDDQGRGGDADDRHRRAVPARGRAAREARQAGRGAARPSGPSRRSCSCARRSAATSCTGRCATAA